MKAFFDTSVLVAAFYADHLHHGPSLAALLRFRKKEAGCGAHTLAEIYATLTGMPGKARVSPEAALLFLHDVQERLTLVALTAGEYLPVLEAAARHRISGGAIYDALLAACARKVRAESVCTWDTGDFSRLGPWMAERLRRPDQLG